MFKQKGIMKQKGFTLLELLVVITLLAILAVGGLVAYDGVTDNAEASAAAYNAGTLDRAVRQYRAVTNRYPDQWDNLASFTIAGEPAGSLAVADGASLENDQFLPVATRQIFGAIPTAALPTQFWDAVANVWGMEEIQHIATLNPNAVPGKQHNEGSNLGDGATTGAIETDFVQARFNNISILTVANADGAPVACTLGTANLSTAFIPNTNLLQIAARQNAINDALGTGRCHVVIALGFGGDAASSTSNASVNIPAAPTYSSPGVDVTRNYGRYIGLFHVARTDSGQAAVLPTDFFARPKLIGFVDTEGKPVDVNIARSRDPIPN